MTSRHPRLRRRSAVSTFILSFALLVGASLPAALSTEAQTDSRPVIHFGFSRSMFREMNESDTRAAVKSYALLLAVEHSLTVAETAGVYNDTAGIADAFAARTADIISMSTEEYLGLPREATRPELFAASQGGEITEQYVLLVRNDASITGLAALKGRKLIVLDSLRTALGSVWLEVMMGERGFGTPHTFFSQVDPAAKTSRAVLPVFFGQADACLVTQRGFEILGELNPQVLRQLRILETSPAYMPHVTAMRASLSDEIASLVVRLTLGTQRTVSGRQILTIFQCDQITAVPQADLEKARELLASRDRLRASHPSATAKSKPEVGQ